MAATQSFDAVFDSPVGRLGIRVQGKALSQLVFLSRQTRLVPAASPEAKRIVSALCAYFRDPAHSLEIKLQIGGTPFQQKVWRALRAIPSGQVMTYGALAERLGTSPRAVGNACRSNPVPLVVPCHRVVAGNGLGGFAGDRQGRLVSVKRRLLQHEGVEIRA